MCCTFMYYCTWVLYAVLKRVCALQIRPSNTRTLLKNVNDLLSQLSTHIGHCVPNSIYKINCVYLSCLSFPFHIAVLTPMFLAFFQNPEPSPIPFLIADPDRELSGYDLFQEVQYISICCAPTADTSYSLSFSEFWTDGKLLCITWYCCYRCVLLLWV